MKISLPAALSSGRVSESCRARLVPGAGRHFVLDPQACRRVQDPLGTDFQRPLPSFRGHAGGRRHPEHLSHHDRHRVNLPPHLRGRPHRGRPARGPGPPDHSLGRLRHGGPGPVDGRDPSHRGDPRAKAEMDPINNITVHQSAFEACPACDDLASTFPDHV